MSTIDTLVVHAGHHDDPASGAVVTPIYQSSTFEYPAGDRPLVYTRYGNNPTQIALQKKVATLEGAEAALVLASGMAALTTAILSVCGQGDHLVAPPDLYGGTRRLLDVDLPGLGVTVTYAASGDLQAWREAIGPQTKLLLWEAISNPLLRVADTGALASLARDAGAVSLVDATFATPVNQRPLEHGVDLVMHSGTKYLGGHSDLIAGVLAGRAGLIQGALGRLQTMGGSADPHAVFLLERGIKTLAVRMRRHNDNGQRVAEFLAGHPRVERVAYPGLRDHPDREIAARVLDGMGGVVTFVPRASRAKAEALIAGLRWIRLAPSLGGVDSLVSMPANTSHRHLSSEERAGLGMPDPMIRLSLGIEAAEDLIDDLDAALGAL